MIRCQTADERTRRVVSTRRVNPPDHSDHQVGEESMERYTCDDDTTSPNENRSDDDRCRTCAFPIRRVWFDGKGCRHSDETCACFPVAFREAGGWSGLVSRDRENGCHRGTKMTHPTTPVKHRHEQTTPRSDSNAFPFHSSQRQRDQSEPAVAVEHGQLQHVVVAHAGHHRRQQV